MRLCWISKGGYIFLGVQQIRECKICKKTFQIIDNAWTRKYCYECSPHEDENCSHAQAVSIKRKAIKRMLIQEAGGKCQNCGYNKCERALEFHHIDPIQKDFGLSAQSLSRDIDTLRQEMKKCILLCANCHAEEHDRLAREGYSQFDSGI